MRLPGHRVPRPGSPRTPPSIPPRGEPGGPAADALLAAAGRGDLRSLGTFYDRTAPLVFGLLCGGLADAAAAERATGRVYLQMWQAAPQFDPGRESARSLLLRTARRELVDRVGELTARRPDATDPSSRRITRPGSAWRSTVVGVGLPLGTCCSAVC